MNFITSPTTISKVISRERHALLQPGDDCFHLNEGAVLDKPLKDYKIK